MRAIWSVDNVWGKRNGARSIPRRDAAQFRQVAWLRWAGSLCGWLALPAAIAAGVPHAKLLGMVGCWLGLMLAGAWMEGRAIGAESRRRGPIEPTRLGVKAEMRPEWLEKVR